MRTFLVIDANSFIHRSYHALPPLTDSAGEPAGALYGLSSILLKIVRENNFDYIAAAYDRPEPTFRKEEFADYKAHRPKAADELISQIIRSKEVFSAFGIPTLESPGFEADDIIGTLATRFGHDNLIDRFIILSGDLDALQLVVDDRVIVWFPKTGISTFTEFNKPAVVAKYGLEPALLPDYKGLIGDTSDNIPGVSGVGPKTAASAIQTYGTLEDLYALSPIPKTEAMRKIIEGKDIALLSKRLATIRTDAPIGDPSIEKFKFEFSKDRLAKFFEVIGFKNLLNRLASPNP